MEDGQRMKREEFIREDGDEERINKDVQSIEARKAGENITRTS